MYEIREGEMMEQLQWIVTEEENGERIDKLVSQKCVTITRMQAQRMLQQQEILVNDKICKMSYKVKKGDKIEIQIVEPKETEIQAENIPLEIVYEDNDIVIVNKAKGMVVHPGNGNWEGTLVNAIMGHCKDSLSGIGGKIRPGIVHRLDKDTSGLIIVAKNDTAHVFLSNEIKQHRVKKTYLALVRGVVKENEATIHMPIARDRNDRIKMTTSKNGKDAITHFKVLKRYQGYTFLEITIETGRTHQIRVHLSKIGYPVVGDAVYSNGKNPFGITGQMLHAYQLELTHPTTGEKMKLQAELPKYFQEVIEKLENL